MYRAVANSSLTDAWSYIFINYKNSKIYSLKIFRYMVYASVLTHHCTMSLNKCYNELRTDSKKLGFLDSDLDCLSVIHMCVIVLFLCSHRKCNVSVLLGLCNLPKFSNTSVVFYDTFMNFLVP